MKNQKVLLVVEDEIPLSIAIKTKLEGNNMDVVTARTADQAIDYLKELGKIDAIWLDHYLIGEKNGLDVLEAIKSEESKWRDVPVFLVSNTASEDKINRYIALGVDKYYLKANKSLQEIIDDIRNFVD